MVNDIISVNGISKSFGPISALCDVSLSVQQGLVTAIVGDNGSGKSTLIKLLSGNLAPDAGTITVEGREHTHLTIAGLADGHSHRLSRPFPGRLEK